MPFDNHAAYLVDKQAKPLQVRSAPYTSPGPNEVVLRARAVAINPIDLGVKNAAKLAFGYISNLHVLGSDVAGEVVEVGKNVSADSFKVGDRAVGHAVSFDKRSRGAPEGAFQEYVVLRTNLCAKIPDTISFERASVIPLGFSTAACGLFQDNMLALSYPQVSPDKKNQTVLVWGGSTSVGSNAIQLARAAGYTVISTSSPRNFAYLKELGAAQVFDYNDATTPAQIIEYLQDKKSAGALAIGNGSLEPCLSIVSAVPGANRVAQLSVPLDIVSGPVSVLSLLRFLLWNARVALLAWRRGVTKNMVNGSDLMANGVGQACYADFLGQALAAGSFVPSPEPLVVGNGLEAVNEGFEYYRKNKVSAKKLVVTL